MRSIVLISGPVLALLCAACSETVAFLSLDLIVPSRTPPLLCADDPRRAQKLLLQVDNEEKHFEETFAIRDETVSLSGIPLGSCAISIQAVNRYGRPVLSGSIEVAVERGENAPQEIVLIEERCSKATCDGDDDQLATSDEEAMGLDPNRLDTDGDGLEDGLEVLQCCSDPLSSSAESCKLLIANIAPGMGVVGDPVMIKASAPLQQPEVQLGQVPLAKPLADNTVVFGQVGPGAVLGEVRLTSGGTEDTYRDLFAVLRSPPELVSEIDQKGGGKLALMQDVVDIAARDAILALLGTSGFLGTTPSAILILWDRQRDLVFRFYLPTKGRPIALAAADNMLVVLSISPSGTTQIARYEVSTSPGLAVKQQQMREVQVADPVALILEPGGQVVQVLFQQALLRLPLDSSDTRPGTLMTLAQLLPLPRDGDSKPREINCTGFTYHAGNSATSSVGQTYLACNALVSSCSSLPRQPCPGTGLLITIDPVEQCLPLAGIPPDDGCWSLLLGREDTLVFGSPLVDEQAGSVYQLTNKGLARAELQTSTEQLSELRLHIPFLHQGKHESPKMMVQDHLGYLYVADGRLVWRLEPRQQDPVRRQGRPFFLGEETDAAVLSLAGDDKLLDLSRRKEGSITSLVSVCLDRCPGCLCLP